jgi:hypothetical protein
VTGYVISLLPCGCYMRQSDQRWFYRPECPLHGHLYPKGLPDSPASTAYRLPAGVYR